MKLCALTLRASLVHCDSGK